MKMIGMIKNNKGTSSVFFAILLTAIAGFAALTVDIGSIVYEKAKLTSSIDAAALAGVQELVTDKASTQNVVKNYVQKNAGDLKYLNILVDESNKTVEVKGTKTVKSYFAKVFGKTEQDVQAIAKAKVENIRALSGARPLAVVQQSFTYGKLYTLKEGGGDGTTGNYAAIALGGSGGSTYRDNLMYGYNGTITVGDIIPTETGNIAGPTQTSISSLITQCNHTPYCTYDYYNIHCPKIIFLPIVNTLNVNGKKCIKVLGFGTFFLEGVTNYGGQADVIGRFITYSMQGETSSAINDYGTYGIKLVK